MFREFMIYEVARMMNGRTKHVSNNLVRGVSIDSRTIRPGDLFFALQGEHVDGHDFAIDAMAKGAVGVVVEREMSILDEIIVPDVLYALGELAFHYRNLFPIPCIAITGTNGKTTVKNLIGHILSTKYNVLVTKKNYNSLIGLPLTIFDLSGQEDFMVIEMGTNNPGEIARLSEISRPWCGVITNIGPGHLKGLKSLEGVRQEKIALIKALPNNGYAVVGDGVGDVPDRTVVKVSTTMLREINCDEYGSSFIYKEREFRTPLLGKGNTYNCLIALLVTDKFGVDHETQFEALSSIEPEPGRLEPIRHHGFFLINDTYNANPLSMRMAIDFVANLNRRKVFILGDMLELGRRSKSLHEDIGKYARQQCDLLVTFGRYARHYGGSHFKDKKKLLEYIRKAVSGEEVILIKASRGLQFETIVEDLVREL